MVAAPGSASISGCFGEHLRNTAGGSDLLQLAPGEEADPSAIRRPEGTTGTLGTVQRLSYVLVELADPEACVGKRQSAAIRRDRDLPETCVFRWDYGEPGHLRRP